MLNLKPIAIGLSVLALNAFSVALAQQNSDSTGAADEAIVERGTHCRINVAGPLYLHESDYSNCVITVQGEGENGALFVLTNGAVNMSNSTIFSTGKVVFLNQGYLNLTLSDVGGEMIVFVQKGSVGAAGANFTGGKICGDVISSDISGASFIAEQQISLDITRSRAGSNLFRTDILGPGAMEQNQIGLTSEVDCRKNLTGLIKFPLGNCPRGSDEPPEIQCDW